MKVLIGFILYINIMLVTFVVIERSCGIEPAVATSGWLEQRHCVNFAPLKSLFWPMYWMYRFWDRAYDEMVESTILQKKEEKKGNVFWSPNSSH
jgi:hypothetical protein